MKKPIITLGEVMNDNNKDNEKAKMGMVFSYLTLRRLVGILGVLFPFLLVLGFDLLLL